MRRELLPTRGDPAHRGRACGSHAGLRQAASREHPVWACEGPPWAATLGLWCTGSPAWAGGGVTCSAVPADAQRSRQPCPGAAQQCRWMHGSGRRWQGTGPDPSCLGPGPCCTPAPEHTDGCGLGAGARHTWMCPCSPRHAQAGIRVPAHACRQREAVRLHGDWRSLLHQSSCAFCLCPRPLVY